MAPLSQPRWLRLNEREAAMKRSKPLTADLAAVIKKIAKEEDLFQHQIAARLDINQGRVSEVLTGKRFPEVQPAS
jgi:predicted XRE-type DNA-binding protein